MWADWRDKYRPNHWCGCLVLEPHLFFSSRAVSLTDRQIDCLCMHDSEP